MERTARAPVARHRRLALVVLALCLIAAAPAPPAPDLVPAHVARKAAIAGRVRVLVELGGAASTAEHRLPHAAAIAGQRRIVGQAQADVRRALRGLVHGAGRDYTSMPYLAIEATPDALRVLGTLRGLVTRVDEDVELRPLLAESGSVVQAPAAWAAGHDGGGTVVAVIDDGVDETHPFLQGKVIEEACYVRGVDGPAGECPNGLDSQVGPGAGLPCAGCTHGTHVAGIAAGNGAAPAGVALSGVARGASLMSIRVFAAGQTSARIAVPARADAVLGESETLVVTLGHPTGSAALGAPSSTTVTIRDATRPAQVRFLNTLVLCAPGCQPFTERLTAAEGYTWLSRSDAASIYQNVGHVALSNFTSEAVGFDVVLDFQGSFPITPGRRYLLGLDVDDTGGAVLWQLDEGPLP
jgi:hypothetical protein